MNLSIIYGGSSSEYSVSIKTGLAIADAIKDLYHVDLVDLSQGFDNCLQNLLNSKLVFNALHGGDGENGNIQKKLDQHNILYTGSGPSASEIAINKNISKHIAESIGMLTPKWIMAEKDSFHKDSLYEKIISTFSYPFIVKPSNEGSTYGLSLVHNLDQLDNAIKIASKYI